MQNIEINMQNIGPEQIEACARAAHEANRAYCIAMGDMSQQPWDDAPEWQRESARLGVAGALRGNTPEQSHEGWLEHKRAEGWVYGPLKDPEKREHPCMRPYSELPHEQRVKDQLYVCVKDQLYVCVKDQLYVCVVRAMASALPGDAR
jgi:hypothetical protein